MRACCIVWQVSVCLAEALTRQCLQGAHHRPAVRWQNGANIHESAQSRYSPQHLMLSPNKSCMKQVHFTWPCSLGGLATCCSLTIGSMSSLTSCRRPLSPCMHIDHSFKIQDTACCHAEARGLHLVVLRHTTRADLYGHEALFQLHQVH